MGYSCFIGELAQLVERLLCKQDVRSSSLLFSIRGKHLLVRETLQTAFIIMTNNKAEYKKIIPPAQVPSLSWYEKKALPEGRTFTCTHRDIIVLDSVICTNAKGQVTNVARSTGTDKENAQAIANNIAVKGLLLDAEVPFLLVTDQGYRLMDGYTRFEAIKSLGYDRWIFNIVTVKEGFTIEDVWDEIGLGANDHPPSKSANRQDFTTRLIRWISVQSQTPTMGQCVDWVNAIPHSFSPKVVDKIVTTAMNTHNASQSMVSLEANDVKSIASHSGVTNVVPLNISGNKTYIQRVLSDQILTGVGESRVMVGYTKGVPASELEEKRAEAIAYVDKINANFEALVHERMSKGSSFKLIDLQYFAGQVLDQENGLIPVSPAESAE